MNSKFKNLLAVCIGVLPINIIMIWYRLTHTDAFTTFDMLVYPLVFGGGNILLILALNRYLLNEKISAFNVGKGKWYFDILTGIILTVIYFVLVFIEQATIVNLLPQREPPSREVIRMMIDLANNPILLIIWLLPVVWIGVALFEELIRTFALNCLWSLSNKKIWQIIIIILFSLLVGFVHLYQGWFGIISISIQSIIMGFYYYRFRRIWPLIISHALYDSFQIIMFVIQVSR